MSRALTAIITDPTGVPIEGMQLDFDPIGGGESVSVRTDAAGGFVVTLETGAPYAVGIIGACRIDGVPQSAVTVIRLTVPDGDDTATLADVEMQTMSATWPVLLARLEALEADVAALKGGASWS